MSSSNQGLINPFLDLVRQGIGKGCNSSISSYDWPRIQEIASEQGLSAVVLDGIEQLPDQQKPPKIFLLEWIGETLQGYEYRYDQYCKAIAELAGFYNRHGYKMMVLKGYACSIDWPKPDHRPCGDIDIWQFGKQKEADEALAKERGIEIDASHHHHTVFYWGEFMVENHYDFINIYHHQSNKEYEMLLKELANDETHEIVVNGEKVYIPSPNLHAAFMLKHIISDFAAVGISLRQLLDWAFFVKAHGKDVDWQWLHNILERFGMLNICNIFNAICVEDLGFEASIFHGVQFNPQIKDKVLQDILFPEFPRELPSHLFPRLIYKYRRWRGNAWKHELCYNENLLSAFWSGLWSHLLKPASI